MGRSDYRPDTRGLRELGTSDAMGELMLSHAERGAEAARAAAPRQSGDYAASITAQRATVTGGWRNERRAGAEFGSDLIYAAHVERADRTLGNAIGVVESS